VDFLVVNPTNCNQIIIECDENGHPNEELSCHDARNFQILSEQNTIIIHFNPDISKPISLEEKYELLLETIRKYSNNIIEESIALYFNYDPSNILLTPCPAYTKKLLTTL
jgi:hypothetical protein